MKFSITSSDMDVIGMFYNKAHETFSKISPKEAALEIIVGDTIYTNPSLNKVQELYNDNIRLTFTYRFRD